MQPKPTKKLILASNIVSPRVGDIPAHKTIKKLSEFRSTKKSIGQRQSAAQPQASCIVHCTKWIISVNNEHEILVFKKC